MAGHNKWKQIKNKKAVKDSKKSREFSKFARAIALESKKTGGIITSPSLRAVIERARANNMPQTNIERAIKKGLNKEEATLEEVVYEAYGPGGSALIIYGLTDNKNRSSQEIKHMLSEYGGISAGPGAASWAFKRQENTWTPQTTVGLTESDKEKLSLLMQKLDEYEDVQGVYTNAL